MSKEEDDVLLVLKSECRLGIAELLTVSLLYLFNLLLTYLVIMLILGIGMYHVYAC